MNIKEIADLAGVSPSTVSKIVNKKDGSIGSQTRERVLRIVREYNYTPYAFAAGAVKKTWLIGILLRSFPSVDPVINGVISAAQERGYTVMLCDSTLSREQELKHITALCKNKVDGILWEPVCEDSLADSRHIEEMNIPYLTIGPVGKDSLCLPYEKLGYELTKELVIRKHRDIACLLSEGRRTAAFLAGYRRCLFDYHITGEESLVFHGVNEELLYQLGTRRISGVVASHYDCSLAFWKLMHSLHYKIPEDFSLVTLRDSKPSQFFTSEISAYTVDGAGFGAQVCRRLISRIEKCKEEEGNTVFREFTLDSRRTADIPFHLQSERITVVGSINIDTYLNVSKLPGTGKTVTTSSSSVYPGGKGINQSIGAAKLGRRVSLIGNVGADLDADRIYRELQEYGVDTSGVRRCPKTDTGRAYIFVEAGGNSMISILTGANDTVTPEDIRRQEQLFEHTGYCLIQSEIPVETVLEACKTARSHQVKTIFKPSALSDISDELLSRVDILIPNEDELGELCKEGGSLKEQAAELFCRGAKTVIVTLGGRGCYVKTGQWEEYVPAADFPAIDKTGASDAFISALAAYLLYGYQLREAVRIATYAAGFCVSREGVVPALIDKSSLEAYIQQKDAGLLHGS